MLSNYYKYKYGYFVLSKPTDNGNYNVVMFIRWKWDYEPGYLALDIVRYFLYPKSNTFINIIHKLPSRRVIKYIFSEIGRSGYTRKIYEFENSMNQEEFRSWLRNTIIEDTTDNCVNPLTFTRMTGNVKLTREVVYDNYDNLCINY